jgi:hypothetical protein
MMDDPLATCVYGTIWPSAPTRPRKQLMGAVFVQALLGGIVGILAGYLISYLLGYLSIPVSTSWEVNLMPAFAKDAAAAAQMGWILKVIIPEILKERFFHE